LISSFGLHTEDSQPDSKKWIETKMFQYKADELKEVKIKSRNKSIELINEEVKIDLGDQPDAIMGTKKEWKKGKISPGITLEDNRVESLVNRIVNFQATDVADPDSLDNCGFDDSNYKVEFTDPAGDTHTFIVGKQLPGDENSYYARILGEDIVYVINKSGFSNLFTTPFEK